MTSLQPLEAAACGGRMEITEAQQPLRLAHDGGWGTRAVGCEAQAQRAQCRKKLKGGRGTAEGDAATRHTSMGCFGSPLR